MYQTKIMSGKNKEEVKRKREERKKAKDMEIEEGGKTEQGAGDAPPAKAEAETVEIKESEISGLTNGTTPTTVPPKSTDGTTSSTSTPDPSTAYFTIVPATSISHPWFDPSLPHGSYTSLSSASVSGIWSYPSTLLERARCSSYRALWEQGMFLGQGVKFGGEFLIYPGDPMRYHSHFVNTTLPSDETVIRPMEMVAWGRLGTATKKAHLICCYDEGRVKESAGERKQEAEGQEDEPEVEFYSLEWGNFG